MNWFGTLVLHFQKSFLPLPHKSNIPSFKGCLVFIKKGEEIRLCETLATIPEV
jgi:hypothetical protein